MACIFINKTKNIMADLPITQLSSLKIASTENPGIGQGTLQLGSMTTAQRDALVNAAPVNGSTIANGTIIFNIETNTGQIYQNGAWADVGGGGAGAGDVVGPANSTAQHLAIFQDNTGKRITDGNVPVNKVATVNAAAGIAANQVVIFTGNGNELGNNLAGTSIQDGIVTLNVTDKEKFQTILNKELLLNEADASVMATNVVRLNNINQVSFGNALDGDVGFLTCGKGVAMNIYGSPVTPDVITVMSGGGGGNITAPVSQGSSVIEFASPQGTPKAVLLTGHTEQELQDMYDPVSGMITYNNDTKSLCAYVGGERNISAGGAWRPLGIGYPSTKGTYNCPSMVIDDNGMISAISDSTIVPGTITGGTGITITGDGTQDPYLVNIENTTVTPGQYDYPSSVSINAQGQIVSALAGDAPAITVTPSSVSPGDIVFWGNDNKSLARDPSFSYNAQDQTLSVGVITANEFVGNYDSEYVGGHFTGRDFALINNKLQTTTIKAADDVLNDVTFTLPGDSGANGYVLTTDGNGHTAWQSNGSGNGDVIGANSSVTDNITTFADNTGKRISDSGVALNQVLATTDSSGLTPLNVAYQSRPGGPAPIGSNNVLALTDSVNVDTNSIGNGSTFIGSHSGGRLFSNPSLKTGSNNTALGTWSLLLDNDVSTSTYDDIIAIGNQSGSILSSSNENRSYYRCIFIGNKSGSGQIDLENAIAIGHDAFVGSSNSTVIGYAARPMSLGVGTYTPLSALHLGSHPTGNRSPALTIEKSLDVKTENDFLNYSLGSISLVAADSGAGSSQVVSGLRAFKGKGGVAGDNVGEGLIHVGYRDVTSGSVTLNGTAGVVVSSAAITPNSIVHVTRIGTSVSAYHPTVGSPIDGEFTIYSNAGDVTSVFWTIINLYEPV